MDRPRDDVLWDFIGRCALGGVGFAAVLLVVAFFRDLLRKSPLFLKLTNSRGNPYSPINWHSHYLKRYRDTNVYYYVELLRLFLNGAICALYIIGTYKRNVPTYIAVIYRVCASFFIADVLSILWAADSALAQVLTIVVMFEAFSIPSLLIAEGPDAFLNFAFLRSIQAYVAFDRLERRLFVHIFSSKRLIGKLFLQCLTLFYTLAAGIQLLEHPGDLLDSNFRALWEGLGDWNFFNSIYFVIVTLSTVGYGDFSPETLQGRIFTILMIIIGIVIFTTVIGELVEKSRKGRGSGSFIKNPDTRHVVVTGTPTLSDLTLFVSEFYSDLRDSNSDAKIVVLVESPTWSDEEWFQRIAKNQFLQARILCLIGSVRNPADLQRARIRSADAVFFLTSPSVGMEPHIQDTTTVMNILAVRNARTDLPIYAQTLLENSSLQTNVALKTPTAFTKGTYARGGRFMREGASYRGLFHQVLKSEFEDLPKVHKRQGRQEFDDVLKYYKTYHEADERFNTERKDADLDRSQLLCLQEMHMALMSGNIRVNGLGTLLANMYLDVKVEKPSLEEPAWISEYHLGATCSLIYAIIPEGLDNITVREIALDLFHLGLVLVATTNPVHIHMQPILHTGGTLQRGDIAMILTYHEQKYVGAALHLISERVQGGFLRHPLGDSMSKDALSIVGKDLFPGGKETLPSTKPSLLSSFGMTPHKIFSTSHRIRLPESNPSFKMSQKRSNHENSGEAVPADISGHVIVAMAGIVPISNLSLFLKGLWSKDHSSNSKKSRRTKVVVIYPDLQKCDQDQFKKYVGRSLFFVEGSPSYCDTWVKAKLATAKSVSTMADYTQPWHMSDARTIFTLLTLEVGTANDHDIYICSELVHEKSLEFLREPIHPRRRGAFLGDNVVSPVMSQERSLGSSPVHVASGAPSPVRSRNLAGEVSEHIMEEIEVTAGLNAQRIADEVQEGHQAQQDSSQLSGSQKKNPLSKLTPLNLGQTPVDKASNVSVISEDDHANPMMTMMVEAEDLEENENADPTEAAGAARARRGSLFSRSRYASGELLIHSSAMTLLAREYTEPGFARFYENLMGTDSFAPGLKVRLLRLPRAFFKQENGAISRDGQLFVPYCYVFRSLIRQGVTPLGLYRSGQAPVLLPTRNRARRGPYILDQLEPFFVKQSSKRRKKNAKVSGIISSIQNLMTDLLPYKQQEAKDRTVVTGAPVNVSESDSDEDYTIPGNQKANSIQNHRPGDADSEMNGKSAGEDVEGKELEGKVAQNDAVTSHPSFHVMSPPSESFFRILENEEEDMEVPGPTKYREHPFPQNMLPYVYTLPEPNTLCAESDGVYILAAPSFQLSSRWAEATSNDPSDNE